MADDFFSNLQAVTDNLNDISFTRFATVTSVNKNTCSCKEDEGVTHENVLTLSSKVKVGDTVVLGFVANSIYNPIIVGVDNIEDYIKEPTVDGSSGQVLTTDGQGGRSWTTVQGGGGGVDIATSWGNPTSNSKVPSEKLTKDTLDLKLNSSDAFSGDYDDLTNKPTIPSKITDLTNDSDFIEKSSTTGLLKNDGTVDTTQYLSSLPSHNHDDRYYTESEVDTALGGKQATLVSGTNIKTINNQSLLGSGNITIQGGGGGASNIFDLDPTSQYGDTVVEEGVDKDGTGLGYGNDILIYNSQESKFYYDKNGNADNDDGNELATMNDIPTPSLSVSTGVDTSNEVLYIDITLN